MEQTAYIDRETGKEEREKILYGDFVRWAYETEAGNASLSTLFKKKFFSSIYGRFQDSWLSSFKIKKFVEEYSIDMGECAKTIGQFKTFNEFFTRKLKPDARPIAKEGNTAICPADSKVLAFQRMHIEQLF